MPIVVEEVTQPDGWDAWLAASQFSDVLQSWEWGEVKKSELWRAIRIRLADGSATVGQAQILTRKMPLGMSLYYMPRGPVLDYQSPRAVEALQVLIDWTKEHANRHHGLMIKLGPAASTMQVPKLGDILAEVGLRPSFKAVQAQHTYVVDLIRSEAAILESFDKDTRNLVRRAAKEGVTVERFAKPDEHKALRTFHNLYMAASESG
jgi:peptidoglycan pentaglycine glycine transferase (the first glycine)